MRSCPLSVRHRSDQEDGSTPNMPTSIHGGGTPTSEPEASGPAAPCSIASHPSAARQPADPSALSFVGLGQRLPLMFRRISVLAAAKTALFRAPVLSAVLPASPS